MGVREYGIEVGGREPVQLCMSKQECVMQEKYTESYENEL